MSTTVTEKENRRIQRYALALPARVEVKVDGMTVYHRHSELTLGDIEVNP